MVLTDRRTLLLAFCAIIMTSTFSGNFGASAQFTNQWAIEVHGGQREANLVASETGCVNEGKKTDLAIPFCSLAVLAFDDSSW